MRLLDLEPQFLRYEVRMEEGEYVTPDGGTVREVRPHVYMPYAATIAEAQGITFLCPVCFSRNSGPIGTHAVICWSRSRGVPDEASPGPGRWSLEGTGYHDLTLNGDPPGGARSVLLTGEGCGWHGFVTAGEVT
jgi:hypothetical protein